MLNVAPVAHKGVHTSAEMMVFVMDENRRTTTAARALHSESHCETGLLRKPAQQWSVTGKRRPTAELRRALMKSAHTKANVLTVGIKAVGVMPGVLPLCGPAADLCGRPISRRHRRPVSTP
ncbi:Hypothetical protein SMAX5B_001749 [Scophthalmus maximus]|uniref:Uncharacterized protein n=1 Tax=Scophthalmus maximus TaxID=52904 RepID=A0A2U9CVT7_SCOMX|nr:Hypothetical protein SMAX5B_001749 [Scophthalmus maximus]